jgi:hypothetical protein
MPNTTIAESSFSHIIDAPIERVDIADWLLHLPSAEYQRCCPPAHIACGATTTDDGRPMSTDVELIGENLMIQQYIGEITDPDQLGARRRDRLARRLTDRPLPPHRSASCQRYVPQVFTGANGMAWHTPISVLPDPPRIEEPVPDAVFISPPRTDAPGPEAVFISPPATAAPDSDAVLTKPPLIDA